MSRSHRQWSIWMLLVAAVWVSGCAPGSIGSLKTSAEVSRQFENLETNPNYRYWYLNQENNPYAIIGLDREYGFSDGPLWRPVEPDSPTFKKVVGLVGSFPVPGSVTTGYSILDNQGRIIGVWYASIGAGVTVDPAAKQVSLATRSPWRTP
jgi:hypothetical protein